MQEALEELIKNEYCQKLQPLINIESLGNILAEDQTYNCLFKYHNKIAIPISTHHFLIPLFNQQNIAQTKNKNKDLPRNKKIVKYYQEGIEDEYIVIRQEFFQQFSIAVIQICQPITKYFGLHKQSHDELIQTSNIKFEQEITPIYEIKNNYRIFCGFDINYGSQCSYLPIEQQFIQLVNSKFCQQVGSLKLSNQNLGLEGVQILVNVEHIFEGLHELSLWWNNLGFQGLQMLMEKQFYCLKVLDLRKNFIKQAGFEILAKKYWPALQYLSLSDNHISTTNCFSSNNFPSLHFLDLQNNFINDSGFAGIHRIHQLKTLNLNSNRFSGSMHLTNSEQNSIKNLKYLYLAYNQIDSCQFLSRINFQSLEFLSIYSNLICRIANTLKKSNLKNLREIWLQKNYISELNFSEANIPQLQTMRLDFNITDRAIEESFNWIFRAQFIKNLQKVYMASKKRVRSLRNMKQYINKKINPTTCFVFSDS